MRRSVKSRCTHLVLAFDPLRRNTRPMIVDAIIVAAGRGQRFGSDGPKQLQAIAGQPMWTWSVQQLKAHPDIRRCVLVVPPENVDHFMGAADVNIVSGGATRARSVKAGLSRLAELGGAPEAVLIHDAARPGLTPEIISRVLVALGSAPAAAPALAVVDALKRQSALGLEGVDRSGLYRVQTPQGFHWQTITTALDRSDADLVDDLAAVEQAGAAVRLVEGDERNDKVTFPADLARVERLMGGEAMAAPVRMGSGYDVHAFEPGDGVMLCGTLIPHTARLKGHSDADVAWHALTDAIFGALALGDIGDHFPPSDPRWKGAPSEVFLSAASRMAAERGYGVSNCDLTVICEAPKVKPHREAMRLRTAGVLDISPDRVSVKATTTEGLGFTGRGEGIAAEAVVVLSRLPAPVRGG